METQRLLDRVNDLIEETDWVAISREIGPEEHPLEKVAELKAALVTAEKKACKILGKKSRF